VIYLHDGGVFTMAGFRFMTTGDYLVARDVVYTTLQNQGFTIEVTGDWSARAERGSQGASILLGAFSGKSGRHLILDIASTSEASGNVVIALTAATSGMSGGLIGMSQAKKAYKETYDAVGTALQAAGVLVNSQAL